MNSFAVSLCLLDKIDTDDRILQEVLVRLSDTINARKVIVDKNKIVLGWYESLAQSTESHRLTTWLQMLSYSQSNYDYVEVDLENENSSISTFLRIASEVKTQKQLIVYDFNAIVEEIDNGNIVQVNGKRVKVINIDEAICKFRGEDAGTTTHKEKIIMGDKITDKSKTEHLKARSFRRVKRAELKV